MARNEDENESRAPRDPLDNPQHSGGPSPPNEVDEMALEGGKTKWMEPSDAAAGDPYTPDDYEALDLLGREGVRGDAIAGVSGLNGMPDLPGRSQGTELPEPPTFRKNPPLDEDAGMGDGGISMSGGAAGGARGSAGTDDRGAGTPEGYERAGPGEWKSTSRFDLDHPTSDVGTDDPERRENMERRAERAAEELRDNGANPGGAETEP